MLLFPTIFCALKVVNMVCLVFAGLIVTYSLMQLQDAGCWTDAATLAAAHLKGTDYSRSLSLSLSLLSPRDFSLPLLECCTNFW